MKPGITPSEWEIMRVLWSQESATNNEIFDVLSEKMDWKMSTVKTLVRRLIDKGYIKANKESREFQYIALVGQDDMFHQAGQELFDQICSKKVGSYLIQLVQDYEMSQGDLSKLQAVIEDKREDAPESVACRCTPGQCNCHTDGH